MSTAETKRSHAEALADAEAVKALFPSDAYERWEVAGSVRRGKPEVSDVEHVVIPTTASGLFGAMDFHAPNHLWDRLDSLVSSGFFRKHVYTVNPSTGEPVYRWGPKYRGVDFHGFNHEIFLADQTNWGSVLAIRTGPADFSRKLVTGLLRNHRRNKDGYVWDGAPCGLCSGRDKSCRECNGTGLKPLQKLPVPTEEEFFRLAGMGYVKPEVRT